MHVAVDLNWFLQFIGLAFAAVFGLLYLVRNTASRYFLVDSSFDSSAADYSLDRSKRETMAASGDAADFFDPCVVCRRLTKKQCAGCKTVRYCCGACQTSHWDEHKTKCKELLLVHKANNTKSTYALRVKKGFVPLVGNSRIFKQSNEILFPYDDFVELFNWNKKGYTPCGLLNCGNSCFANAVLQCLTHTRPLVAYLLEKGHKIECQRDDWCFFCEFQTHVERCSQSRNPFSPINILSRLPNIGGNLGYGKQEDAHEFMRFAIDNMQSACLDRYGGEKAVHPSCQETTLIQHIFGGRLQSQVKCTQCHNISSQFENMMDLTVEIHGDAESLEECLDQFTAEEQLHGDNMYKCDSCNAYVKAWKRLSIRRAPNILTVALKRFQSGRFGKLNKRVTFPDTLDLGDYMSELEDGNDIYKLYAVIVHVDMLNASFFGHYICYIKNFSGNWYRIDDCKVATVDLDEVLSQSAYMVMYSRVFARPSCLRPDEPIKKEENNTIQNEPADNCVDPGRFSSASELTVSPDEELLFTVDTENDGESIIMVSSELDLPVDKDAPEQVTSPVNNSNEIYHEISVQSDIKEDELSSPMVIDGDSFWGSQAYANEDLFKYLAADKSCTFEQGNNTNNASVDDMMNPSILESTSENAKSSIEDAPRKSEVKSPKPLFAPGFLGKCPGKKYCKTLNEGSVDLSSPMLVDIDSRSQTDAKKDLLVEKSPDDERCTITPENSSVVRNDPQDASTKKSIPAEKPKPLFTRGFLGKRPVKEYVNPVSEESAPMLVDSSLGNQINGNSRNAATPEEHNGTTESAKCESDNISDKESPVGKLKPIFAPGFLGKRPCTKEKSASPKRYLKQSNEVGFLKDEEKTCDVHVNGNGLMESCISKSVANGDSCDQNGFCEGTLKMTKGRM